MITWHKIQGLSGEVCPQQNKQTNKQNNSGKALTEEKGDIIQEKWDHLENWNNTNGTEMNSIDHLSHELGY